MIKGQDSSFNTGRTIALTRPRITAIPAKTVQAFPSTWIPGTNHAATKREKLIMAQRIRSFMKSSVPFSLRLEVHCSHETHGGPVRIRPFERDLTHGANGPLHRPVRHRERPEDPLSGLGQRDQAAVSDA